MILVALLLIAFSNAFGRAEPTGRYRPLLPPAALETGCYPLPDGVRLDFSFQVRSDGDVETDSGPRRRLEMQYNFVGEEELRSELLTTFTRAGFEVVRELPLRGEVIREETGPIAWVIHPLDVADDATVQGSITFDLPVVERQSDSPVCEDPFATKRFPETFLHQYFPNWSPR